MNLALVLAAVLVPALALATLSGDQLTYVFGDATGLKGAHGQALDAFDFTLVANTTHALVALQLVDGGTPASTAQDIGWIGFGSGDTMVGSDDLVFWQSSAGKWVVSRREPTMDTQSQSKDPGDAGASPSDFGIIDALSTSKGAKVLQVVFIRKLKPSYTSTDYTTWKVAAQQPFVFARSSTSPKDGDSAATIGYHDVGMGPLFLDITDSVSTNKQYGEGTVIDLDLPASTSKSSAHVAASKIASTASTTASSKDTDSKTTPSSKDADGSSSVAKSTPSVGSGSGSSVNGTVSDARSAADPNDTPSFCQTGTSGNATDGNPCHRSASGSHSAHFHSTLPAASGFHRSSAPSKPISVPTPPTVVGNTAGNAAGGADTVFSAASSLGFPLVLLACVSAPRGPNVSDV